MSSNRHSPIPTRPNAANTVALRHCIERGVAALKTALACLPLTGKEQVLLERLLAAHSRTDVAVRPDPSNPKKPRIDQAPERQAARSAAKASKKQLRAAVAKKVQMLEERRRAEIQEVHRKSGYSNYVRRLPGSFEGGKK